EEYEGLLTSAKLDFIYVEGVSLYDKVKMAIDAFDPYVFLPGDLDGGPDDEYDSISERITNKIEGNMRLEEIAAIIGQEFEHSFGESFSVEDCLVAATTVYEYVNRNK